MVLFAKWEYYVSDNSRVLPRLFTWASHSYRVSCIFNLKLFPSVLQKQSEKSCQRESDHDTPECWPWLRQCPESFHMSSEAHTMTWRIWSLRLPSLPPRACPQPRQPHSIYFWVLNVPWPLRSLGSFQKAHVAWNTLSVIPVSHTPPTPMFCKISAHSSCLQHILLFFHFPSGSSPITDHPTVSLSQFSSRPLSPLRCIPQWEIARISHWPRYS